MKKTAKHIICLLTVVALCVTAVMAATVSSKWSGTIEDDYGNAYHGMTSATSNGRLVQSTASTVTVDGTNVPAGYAEATALLYRGSDLAAQTVPKYNTVVASGVTATTPQAGGSGNYTGVGTSGCWNGSSYEQITIPTTPVLQVAGSRSTDTTLFESLPEEDKQVYINESGETYGTALASDLSGVEYDLVSAIGIHGIEGYIRSTDRPQSASSPEEALARMQVAQDQYIPIYKADGITIVDEFLIGSGLEN